MSQSNLSFEKRNLHSPVTSTPKNCIHQVHITYTGCHHDILLEHIFLDRMAMDLFSEIHTKSRSTQAYCVDAFWVIICSSFMLDGILQQGDVCSWGGVYSLGGVSAPGVWYPSMH